MKSIIILAFFYFIVLFKVDSFSKYGRTCKDIGCRPNEDCVIKSDHNGSYPDCVRKPDAKTCSSIVCPENFTCTTVPDGIPTCKENDAQLFVPAIGKSKQKNPEVKKPEEKKLEEKKPEEKKSEEKKPEEKKTEEKKPNYFKRMYQNFVDWFKKLKI